MNFSMAFCSGMESGYILPRGTGSPGSRSVAQSHSRCGGSLEACFGAGYVTEGSVT